MKGVIDMITHLLRLKVKQNKLTPLSQRLLAQLPDLHSALYLHNLPSMIVLTADGNWLGIMDSDGVVDGRSLGRKLGATVSVGAADGICDKEGAILGSLDLCIPPLQRQHASKIVFPL